MESSHANNIGMARFVNDFFNDINICPHRYPRQGRTDSTGGKVRVAVDGFPIKLIINGQEMGIFTFNIDRYAFNNLGFSGETSAVAYEIGTNSSLGSGAFMTDDWDNIASEFEYRYHYAGDEDTVTIKTASQNEDGSSVRVLKYGLHDELQKLVTFIYSADNEEFNGSVGREYLSIEHFIDYYLLVYFFGLVDNFGKNMSIATWERNNAGNFVWFPMFYDCDSMLGLNNEGYVKFDAGVDFQDNEYNTSNSKLWTKLRDEKNFGSDIQERYHALRDAKILDADYIMSYFESIIYEIGEKFYNWDARLKYVTLSDIKMDQDGNKIDSQSTNVRSAYLSMCNGNRLEWTRRWLNERIIYMDSIYNYGDFMKSNIVLRSQSHTGPTTIKIKTYSPQRVTIRFSDANTSDSIVTKRCGRYNTDITATDGWYDFTGQILNANDNNITIVGGHNVMNIGGLEEIDLASLKLASAPKLTSLNIPGATSLIELEVSNNYMLQEIDLSGCKKLGEQTNYQSVDLSSAKYLKKLNVSNTKLRNITVSETGGVLEDFNISNSYVTSIVLNKQPYLEELDLASCTYLSEVHITDCESMNRISIPGTKISKFYVKDLPSLTYVDISSTAQLAEFSVQNCDALDKLIMQNIASTNLKTLDVSTCLGLTYLDIRNCPHITRLRFYPGYDKLTTLILSSSGVIDTQFGNETPDGFDLSPFKITSISFSNCQKLVKVKGLNLTTSSGGAFSSCTSLKTVQGTIKLTGGGASNLFQYCRVLETFPEPGIGAGKLDITNVTNASGMFYEARITYANLKKVLKQLGKCENLSTAFYYAKELTVSAADVLTTDWQQILWPLVSVTNINYLFTGCNIAEFEISDEFFRYNTKLKTMNYRPFPKLKGAVTDKTFSWLTDLEDISSFFSGCTNLLSVDEYAFVNNKELKQMWSLFSGCTNLDIKRTSGNGFSSNGSVFLQMQGKLSNADNLFNGCKSLSGSLPSNLLINCSSLKSMKCAFSGCTSLTGEIPVNLFNYPANLSTIDNFFNGCTGLTGPIRTSIWSSNNNIVYCSGLFSGCSGLGKDPDNDQEIPEDFFLGKTKISNISSMFRGCSGLRFRLIGDWFKDLRDLTSISHLFNGCSGLSGNIPETLFTVYNADGTERKLIINAAEAVFKSCSGLTGNIPRNLFKYFTEVQSLNEFFYGCFRLSGAVPAREDIYEEKEVWDEDLQAWVTERTLIESKMGLLDNCKELLTCNHMFYYCSGIGKNPLEVTEEDPYCLPPNLFSFCTKLQQCNYMFYMYQPDRDPSRQYYELRGEIPPTLFKGLSGLTEVAEMFAYQENITGKFPATLFSSQDSRLKTTEGFAIGCGLTKLENPFVENKHTGLTSVRSMFYGCGQMEGMAKPFIDAISYVSDHTSTFLGCSKLSDFNADYMDGWK